MSNCNKISICSSLRVPFEPRGETLELKQRIRELIGALQGYDTYSHLVATFTTDRREYSDVENILFYNIGLGAFAHFSLDEISFKIILENNGPIEGNTYSYSVSDQSIPNTGVDEIIRFSFQLNGLNGHLNVFDYFKATKAGAHQQINPFNSQNFGLNLTIETPQRVPRLDGILKCLLDGIISSFHSQAELDNELLELIAIENGMTVVQLRSLLEANEFTFLGNKRLVYPYRTRYKWNPSDEKCIEVNLKQRVNTALDIVRINGLAYNI